MIIRSNSESVAEPLMSELVEVGALDPLLVPPRHSPSLTHATHIPRRQSDIPTKLICYIVYLFGYIEI